jgi:hypothetical protein
VVGGKVKELVANAPEAAAEQSSSSAGADWNKWPFVAAPELSSTLYADASKTANNRALREQIGTEGQLSITVGVTMQLRLASYQLRCVIAVTVPMPKRSDCFKHPITCRKWQAATAACAPTCNHLTKRMLRPSRQLLTLQSAQRKVLCAKRL